MDTSSAVQAAERQAVGKFYCDSCEARPSTGARFKCQVCPDFDYCEKCIVDAHLIHPCHEFKNTGTGRSDDLSEPSLKEKMNDGCRSCGIISKILPVLHLVEASDVPQITVIPGEKYAKYGLWDLRISKLIEATQRGCIFCAFFMNKFFVTRTTLSFTYDPVRSWYADFDERSDQRQEAVAHCMKLLLLLDGKDRFCFRVQPSSLSGLELPDFDSLEFTLEEMQASIETVRKADVFLPGVVSRAVQVYAAADNPTTRIISTRPPNPFPESQMGLMNYKSWLTNCEQNHGGTCNFLRSEDSAVLPTRLIDLEAEANLYVRQTSCNEQWKYATLSYCWGGPQDFQTLSSTLPDRLNGFPVSVLPKTLQDAVYITRSLGLQYLWIDSLCIIQDDPADKAKEIGKMADIYKHSYITICAARAGDANDGFLKDNSDRKTGLWKSLLPLRYPLPSKEAKTFQEGLKLPSDTQGILWLNDEPRSFATIMPDALACRGWCLQERILSPRILSFGRWPTWRCSNSVDSDGGYYENDDDKRHDDRLTTLLLQASTAIDGRCFLEPATMKQLYQGWYKLVNDYTKRKLHQASDRLPAIGGIATEVARVTGDRYLAGLWQKTLLRDLMWSTKTCEWLSRPTEWRAPSWSWASVDSPVTYGDVTEDATGLASIVSCGVIPKHRLSSFGEVDSGSLVITGPFVGLKREHVFELLKKQQLARPPPDNGDAVQWLLEGLEDERNSAFNQHDDLADKIPAKVFGLVTFRHAWSPVQEETIQTTCYSGLLLKECTKNTTCYERIGAFMNELISWPDPSNCPWEVKEIVII